MPPRLARGQPFHPIYAAHRKVCTVTSGTSNPHPGLLAPLMAIMLLLAASACSVSGQRMAIDLTRPAASEIHDGVDNETLMASVASVVKNLSLPLNSPLHAYFYPSREAFEIGLLTDAKWAPWAASNAAVYATGAGTYYGILIRADRFNIMPLASRVHLIAHELTHVSQFEMTGGRHTGSDQWLREGFGDWVAYWALDRLRLRSFTESRQRVLRSLQQHRSTDRFPSLGALATFRDFTTAVNQLGWLATYGQAFLATDWLIERAGQEATVDYFRRFGRSDDQEANFEAAFKLRFRDFEAEFRSRLAALAGGES